MARRLRIAYVHETLEPGGAEIMRQTLLATILSDPERRKAIDPLVICLREPGTIGEQIARDGIRVIPLRWRGSLPSPVVLLRLARLLRSLRPEIVQTSLYQANIHGAAAARMAGCPRVLMQEHSLNTWWMGRREKILSRLAAALSTRVVTISRFQARHLIEKMFYPEHKMTVIHNCINPLRLGARAGFVEYRKNTRRITCVGNLRSVKNHALLFEAFRTVLKTQPELRLIVAGDGPLRAGLESLARQMGIADQVDFPGYVSEVRDLLADTDIFVHASWNETFCLAMAEAMYAGCPCVCPDAGVMPELTGQGEAALLFPPDNPPALAEAILELIDDWKARQRLGRRAADYVTHHYLPHHHIERVMELYGL